jgi:hypothetical protein
LYPNPASDAATLALPAGGATVVTLVDARGREVITERTDEMRQVELDLSGCAPGVYHVLVRQDGHMARMALTVDR